MADSRASILVIGATGNTGVGVVEKLSDIISAQKIPLFRVIAVTRDSKSEISQKLSSLPHVKIEEKYWPDLTSEWLIENNVKRVYLASVFEPAQFGHECALIFHARNATVEHFVKLSTVHHWVSNTFSRQNRISNFESSRSNLTLRSGTEERIGQWNKF